ncbi:MAG: hypothetical protein HRT53_00955 [Colwellia sp.]|nr:hypothetical protein [Colwellia sp.]
MKYPNFIIVSISLLLLNGCLDDNHDNTDVAQAINAQTEVISAQQNSESSVTFHGVVVDIFDAQPVSTALITVNLGSELVVEDLIATDGKFEISKLPANSDIEVIISSEDGQFLTRAFFFNTGDSSANVAIKDFGSFAVSEPQLVQITVLNSDDNSSVDNLEFNAYSHVGNSSSTLKYKHSSSYDAVNGRYSIIVPKHINTSVRANLDLNRDGDIDFIPESSSNLSGSDLYIGSANAIETLTLYVADNKAVELSDVEYRISIIDNTSNSIAAAELVVEDVNNPVVKSVYDTATEQHVVTAKFSQSITLNMPAFSDNGIHYQSASIRLSQQSDETISVYISGINNNCCFNIPNSETIELALLPRITSNVSSLEVVNLTREISESNPSFSVFYSQAVSIPGESISLNRTNGYATLKGNDHGDDLILPGTTLFTGGLVIATSHTMTLNNTKLEVTPTLPLVVAGSYQYTVGNVEVNSTNEIINISGDSFSFDISGASQVFDINDVKLDNQNFTTGGTTITTVNTANEASTSSDYDQSVYFYMPTSINSLQNFTMRQLSVTEDNIARTDVSNFTIVNDGNIYISRVGTVKLAENEVIVNENMQINIQTGTAQEDSQLIYRTSNYEYMSDNTDASTNTISFEYAYETLAGEVFTGTITIPVQ